MITITKLGDPIFFYFCLSLILTLYLCPLFSNGETDTLLQGQELKDGYHLDSAFGAFRLGFFTAADNNRYLGIWYNMPDNQQYYYHSFHDYYERRNPELRHSPVWVSNPDSPILNKTGVLVLASDGNLKIVDGKGDLIVAVTSITHTRTAVEKGVKTSAVLLDSGNFVLRELNPDGGSVERQLWQSFDYPTDIE